MPLLYVLQPFNPARRSPPQCHHHGALAYQLTRADWAAINHVI